MWGADTNDDEGGFNVTMTQSPAAGAEQKQNTVISVAIRELLENNEENKNTHAVVVGIIKQVKIFLLINIVNYAEKKISFIVFFFVKYNIILFF